MADARRRSRGSHGRARQPAPRRAPRPDPSDRHRTPDRAARTSSLDDPDRRGSDRGTTRARETVRPARRQAGGRPPHRIIDTRASPAACTPHLPAPLYVLLRITRAAAARGRQSAHARGATESSAHQRSPRANCNAPHLSSTRRAFVHSPPVQFVSFAPHQAHTRRRSRGGPVRRTCVWLGALRVPFAALPAVVPSEPKCGGGGGFARRRRRLRRGGRARAPSARRCRGTP